MSEQTQLTFNGPCFDQELDGIRLTGQLARIYHLMKDGTYRTLNEISLNTGDPESSVSAQLRHLRKPRFGLHIVNKRRRLNKNGQETGVWEYQLIPRTWPEENTPEVIRTPPTLVYSGDTVKLTRFLPHAEWVAVCNKLQREGYTKVNSRFWRK